MDIVDQWLKSHGRLFEGGEPRTKEDALKRFKCPRLAGGCILSGKDCAARHVFAIARSKQKKKASDGVIYWAHRDDAKCVDCPFGAARAELLGNEPTDWKRAYSIYKRKRHKASLRRAKEADRQLDSEHHEEHEEHERENDNGGIQQDSIDWPVDCRPRNKEYE